VVAHVAKLLDRACPRCGAPAGIKCRDSRRPQKTAAREHIARGWLDRPCPTCRVASGELCVTPSGRAAAEAHRARWHAPRLVAQRYGYVWVAPDERDVEQSQRDALSSAGCERIWVDRPLLPVEVGGSGERERLLAYLRSRDILVVWRLDRLARSASELAGIAATLRARRVALCSLSEDLDSTRPGGEQLFDTIAAVAGLAPAAGASDKRPGGRSAAHFSAGTGGRPRLLDEQANVALRAMYDAGEHTIEQIAARYGVSRPTVYRALKRTQPSQNP
jgi:DNA invertase Pin-like site-specific DNA recombinase